MNKNGSKGVRGCVTASDPAAAGFFKYPYTTKSENECLKNARLSGVLCGPKNKGSCSYFIFTNRSIDDKLREGNIQHKNGDNESAIQYFKQAWRSLTKAQRQQELNLVRVHNKPERFMNGFGGWIAKTRGQKTDYFQEFVNSSGEETVPLPLEGNCWVGGSSVLDSPTNPNKPNPHILLSEEVVNNPDKKAACKYNLFEVPPDVPGLSSQEQMIRMYKRRVSKDSRQLNELQKKIRNNKIALQIAKKNTKPWEMIAEAVQIQKDMEREARLKPHKEAALSEKKTLEKNLGTAKVYNLVSKMTNHAVNSSSKLVNEQKKVDRKIKADIENINWSLEESNRQEALQNKITTTLSILIVLFVILCVGLLIYYMMYEKPGGSPVNSLNKTSNGKYGVIKNIFSKKSPKGGVPGVGSDKSAINSIFSFGKK